MMVLSVPSIIGHYDGPSIQDAGPRCPHLSSQALPIGYPTKLYEVLSELYVGLRELEYVTEEWLSFIFPSMQPWEKLLILKSIPSDVAV